jgi:hypothetical protein
MRLSFSTRIGTTVLRARVQGGDALSGLVRIGNAAGRTFAAAGGWSERAKRRISATIAQ